MTTRLAALAILLLPGTALANRIISFSVSVENGPALTARGMDNGDAPMASVWRRLGNTELEPEAGKPGVTPDAGDPLRATLKGNITVSVNEGKARPKELRLVRASEKSGWTVHPDDVEATAKQAGYEFIPAEVSAAPEPAKEQPLKKSYVVWYALATVLIGLAAGLMVRRKRKAKLANRSPQ